MRVSRKRFLNEKCEQRNKRISKLHLHERTQGSLIPKFAYIKLHTLGEINVRVNLLELPVVGFEFQGMYGAFEIVVIVSHYTRQKQKSTCEPGRRRKHKHKKETFLFSYACRSGVRQTDTLDTLFNVVKCAQLSASLQARHLQMEKKPCKRLLLGSSIE